MCTCAHVCPADWLDACAHWLVCAWQNAQFIDVVCRRGALGERLADAIVASVGVAALPEQVFDFSVVLFGVLFAKIPDGCGSRAAHQQLLAALKGRHDLHPRYVAMVEVRVRARIDCACVAENCVCAGLSQKRQRDTQRGLAHI